MLFGMCLCGGAGFLHPRLVASAPRSGLPAHTEAVVLVAAAPRSGLPARTEAVVLLDLPPILPPTLKVLTGLLVLSPFIELINLGIAKRSLEIEEFTNTSKTYQKMLAVLSSTALVTAAFEVQYTAAEDVGIRIACASVVLNAVTFATLAAFKAEGASIAAAERKMSLDKYVPLLSPLLTFFFTYYLQTSLGVGS